MGRYTTIQTLSDQDAQGAALPYTSVVTPLESSKDVADGVSEMKDTKLRVNRVENVSGSGAGAGSGEFHTYRAARRREMERVEMLETRYKQNKAQQEFQAMRKRKVEEFEAKIQKRAEKRRRRKERFKMKALDAVQEEQNANEKEKEDSVKKEEQVPETPGGVAEVPNDGSFLEKMLALQKEQEKSKEK
ncbi:unnamed protein product [Peronospora belbahrii]|uniref:PRKR-interacting protein 1 n=1 Tax=Peronospora belbahrii TaxID=622444 RepID=A0AAU9KU18_9STRA|nr:unnamed protein product [Peronospora belbahrii]CAH0516177.1 unnamed protein product [Peronospora belbahrii]